MEHDKRNTSTKIAGVVFTGCLFMGLGIGMLLEKTAVGMFVGAGAGFVLMGVIWAVYNRRERE